MLKKSMTARYIAIIWSVITFGIATQYNACSKVGFSASPNSSNVRGEGLSDISINGGARFTNDTNVELTLNSPGAVEMYITNDSNCNSGQWEPYLQTRKWTLGASNQKASVYAKFRGPDFTDPTCVMASIVHDNIAPAVDIDLGIAALTNNSNILSTFHATDSGSGVDLLLCILPQQVSSTPCNGSYMGTALPDGGYMVQFLANDLAGNVSTPTSQFFTVDTTPPVVTLVSTPPALSGSTSATFGFSGTDNLSGIHHFECNLDSQAADSTCTSGNTYVNLAAGSHTFSVRAVDNAGNISPPTTYAWRIDTTAPTIRFTQVPAALSNSASATFAFVGTDDTGAAITHFECHLNSGTFTSCTSPDLLSGLHEGSNTFGVRGITSFNIYSSEITYTWTVDLTPPTVQILSGPATLTNSNSANFVFSANDGLSGITSVECSLDGGAATNCAALVANYVSLAGDTQHTFEVSAVDGAGNRTISAPYIWMIDNTPPTIQIVSKPSALTANSTASFALAGSDLHGPITFQCKLDSATMFTSCPSTMTYPTLADGTHTFYAQDQDAAGNLSAVVSYSWTVETMGPTITFTQTPKATILTTDQGVLSYTVTDAVSTVASVTCTLDSTSITPCPMPNGTLTFPPLAAGSHKFTLVATNSLGNSSTLSFTFTANAPSCTTTLTTTTIPTKMLFIVDMSGSNQSAPGCTLSANCTDPGKTMRAGSIQQFYNDYGSHSNFTWAFDIFQGSTSTALINSGSPSSPIFSNATTMQTAINSFKAMTDQNYTPYLAALKLATTAISNDPDLNAKTSPPQYIVVFMSDGLPYGSGDTTAAILNQIKVITALSPGRISFNAVYYGPVDASASGLIQSMAAAGNGNFLNTNTNPTGLDFQISNLVSVPVTVCK